MMIPKLLVGGGVCVLLAGCASMTAAMNPPAFKSKVDAYDGSAVAYEGPLTTTRCTDSWGHVDGAPMPPDVYLALTVVKHKGQAAAYAIEGSYYHDGWLFIQPGNSLDMLVDGVPVHLSSVLGSTNSRSVSGGIVSESAIYPVSYSDIKVYSQAKRIQFRLKGDKGWYEGCVLTNQIPAIGDFLRKADAAGVN